MLDLTLYLSKAEATKLEDTAKLCESTLEDFIEALVVGCLDEGVNINDFEKEESLGKDPVKISLELSLDEFKRLENAAKGQNCSVDELVKYLVFKAINP